MDLREHLRTELRRRRDRNPRYSLRAFARDLGAEHSGITRLLSGGGRITDARARRLAEALGLGPSEIEDACLHEAQRRVEELVAAPGFRADSRWLAERTGLRLDHVNVALHLLLHHRRIEMSSADAWTRKDPA